MKATRVIANGRVWTESGPRDADVLIGEDGRVIRLIDRGEGASAGVREGEGRGRSAVRPGAEGAEEPPERFDASGMWVLPGAIDVHVHFREPGLTQKEDFLSGSQGAVLGGVTTVLDMPNTIPPVSDADRWIEKARLIEGRSYADYGLFTAAVAGEESPGEETVDRLVRRVAGAVEAGAVAVKVFLGPTTGDIRAPGWGELYALCRELAGRTVFVFHCEDRDVINAAARLKASLDPADYASLLAVRPRFGEIAATAGALRLALTTGARVHIAHVALKEAVADIRAVKEQGAPVTAETCPQYLFLSEDDYDRLGTRMKVLPPIRSRSDQAALWEGMAAGTIDCVATDHAPHARGPEEEGAAVWEGSFGMAGVQLVLPLMIDAAISGRCTPADVVRWTSANPARAFGLYPVKGCLEPGADADIAVVDPSGSWRVERPWWASKSDNTAFWGRTGRGRVVATFLRGRLAAADGRVAGPPAGRRVPALRQ